LTVSPHRPGKIDGRGHAVFELREPVTVSQAGHRKPKVILKEVMRRLAAVLGGDPGYTGVLTKNPCSPAWVVWGSGKMHNLVDLLNQLKAISGSSTSPLKKPVDNGSRNVAIFDSLRHWAYRTWSKWPSLSVGHAECLAQATRLNREFARPLHDAEIGHIAKSVANWCWKHRPTTCDRGRDHHLTAGLSQRAAAQIAGKETATRRREATDRKVQDAFDRLFSAGHLDPSARAIADEAGVSRDTVRRWRRRQLALRHDEICEKGVQTVHQMVAGCCSQPAPSGNERPMDGNTAKPCPSPVDEAPRNLAREQERGSAGQREIAAFAHRPSPGEFGRRAAGLSQARPRVVSIAEPLPPQAAAPAPRDLVQYP